MTSADKTAHFSDPAIRRRHYLNWANESVAALRHIIAMADLNRLILTPAFWHIQAITAMFDAANVLTISTEIDARKAALTHLHTDLQTQVERWTAGRIVIPDTTMFIRHDKLAEWDLAQLLSLAEDEPLHIVVPMVVVDEHDRLKEATKEHTRWRGRYSTAVLDRVLPNPLEPGELRPKGYEWGRGRVTVEVLLDPPGHVRQSDEDAEIVD